MVTKDFAELFACFNARSVEAVVVGSTKTSMSLVKRGLAWNARA
jgi:hypothetical protein